MSFAESSASTSGAWLMLSIVTKHWTQNRRGDSTWRKGEGSGSTPASLSPTKTRVNRPRILLDAALRGLLIPCCERGRDGGAQLLEEERLLDETIETRLARQFGSKEPLIATTAASGRS
jgi:hypothetical protein